jgi:hypothetical protein
MDPSQIAGALLMMALGALIAVFGGVAWTGRRPTLRPLPGLEALRGQQGRAIETGQSLHLSLGTSGIGGGNTATTLAGLAILESLADEAAATDTPPMVTVADPTALVIAQDVLRRAYARQGNPAGYDPRTVRYVAASPLPYAAGVSDILSLEETSANVMAGVFGPEVAFITEEGSKQAVLQVAGAVDVAPLAVMYPSVNHLMVGEEMFAASAYMDNLPVHTGSLLAQDVIRWLLVALLFVASAGALLQRVLGGPTP